MNTTITFEKASLSTQELVKKWLSAPHVAKWFYGAGLDNTIKNLDLFCSGKDHNGKYQFTHWIAYLNDSPIGFIMTSDVVGPFDQGEPYNKYYQEGQSCITMDILIGEVSMTGQGLGPVLIKELLRQEYPTIDTVLIDPSVENFAAIRAYEKAGFVKTEQFTTPYDSSQSQMMVRNF